MSFPSTIRIVEKIKIALARGSNALACSLAAEFLTAVEADDVPWEHKDSLRTSGCFLLMAIAAMELEDATKDIQHILSLLCPPVVDVTAGEDVIGPFYSEGSYYVSK